MRHNPLREPKNGIRLLFGRVTRMRERTGRMKAIKLHGFLHIDGTGNRIGRHDVTELLLVQCVERIARLDRTLLGGILILIDRSPFLRAHLGHPLLNR